MNYTFKFSLWNQKLNSWYQDFFEFQNVFLSFFLLFDSFREIRKFLSH